MSGCPCCDFDGELEVKKEVNDTNEVVEDGLYCPSCSSTFDEQPVFWTDQDFPLWVSYESYNDSYRLLRNLERQTDAHYETIPDEFSERGSPFKYTVFTVYFKVTEDGGVEGPYDEKRGEKL